MLSASVTNNWPRPGLTGNTARGIHLIGHYAADHGSWVFARRAGGLEARGYSDELAALDLILRELRSTHKNVGAIGYVSYEWGARQLGVDRAGTSDQGWAVPEVQFLIYESLLHPTPGVSPRVRAVHRQVSPHAIKSELLFRPLTEKSRYLNDVATIKEWIAAGDVYQANYTQAFEFDARTNAEESWSALAESVPAAYSVFLNFDACRIESSDGMQRQFSPMSIMSVSPERFWRMSSQRADSRPIKGTIARGASQKEDVRLRRRLLTSRKDRAELLMITDLVRNDLGQVATIGSVRTNALVRVRPTPSVWHLESIVSADLAPDTSWVDVMRALAPAGSITGTPKRRAVEILNSLEQRPRGAYCGAIGWVDAQGNADFAVGIRTCLRIGNKVRLYSGGGIVADSDPEAEYEESLIKIAPLIKALLRTDTVEMPDIANTYA